MPEAVLPGSDTWQLAPPLMTAEGPLLRQGASSWGRGVTAELCDSPLGVELHGMGGCGTLLRSWWL